MKYLAAYLLAALGGHANPSAAEVTKILESVGATVDEAELNKVLGELNGKDLNAIIAQGRTKLSSGGGAAPAAAAAAPAASSGAAPAAAAAKGGDEPKAEKKKSSSSEHGDLGGGLFGGDDGW